MSLGPPFDDSGERLQIGVGAAAGAALMFVAAFAVLAAERSLGDSIRVHVQVARPGALHTGAPLRVGGDTIGEVVAIRGHAAPFEHDAAPVDIEVRLQSRYRERVYRNSTIVAVNPTLLTEALLEVGPPARGAAPQEPVKEGDRLRGVDPADIDRFMLKLYVSVESILRESRELQPEWTAFHQSVVELAKEVRSTLPAVELLRIGVQAGAARSAGTHLFAGLASAGASAAPADVAELLRTVGPLVAELARLGQRLATLEGRASDMAAALGGRQRDLESIRDGLRSAAANASRAETDAEALWQGFAAGRGTLGGFNCDIQLFDELKELHRILKRRPWRILIKRPDAGQRNVR